MAGEKPIAYYERIYLKGFKRKSCFQLCLIFELFNLKIILCETSQISARNAMEWEVLFHIEGLMCFDIVSCFYTPYNIISVRWHDIFFILGIHINHSLLDCQLINCWKLIVLIFFSSKKILGGSAMFYLL